MSSPASSSLSLEAKAALSAPTSFRWSRRWWGCLSEDRQWAIGHIDLRRVGAVAHEHLGNMV